MQNQSQSMGGSPFSSKNTTNELMCRICHEGESKETLFAFCKCSGTLAMAHRSCLEKWLSTAQSSACEICRFAFQTSRKPRPILDVCNFLLLCEILSLNNIFHLHLFSGSVHLMPLKTQTTWLEIWCASWF